MERYTECNSEADLAKTVADLRSRGFCEIPLTSKLQPLQYQITRWSGDSKSFGVAAKVGIKYSEPQ